MRAGKSRRKAGFFVVATQIDVSARRAPVQSAVKVNKEFTLLVAINGSYFALTLRHPTSGGVADHLAESEMATNWRISTFNGALLASYFIPTWVITAFKFVVSPVHSLYEQPSISLALFASDHLHLAGLSTVRLGWLLAFGRLTVAAFFALFLVLITRPAIRKTGGCDEALAIALGIGSLISFACMIMASQVGETGALRLHATELMLMLGTAIVMLLEPAPRSTETAQNWPPERATYPVGSSPNS